MYNSLKPWINLPVDIKPYISMTGTGKKNFGQTVSTVCYAAGKVQVVNNSSGKEVVSNKQLYFDGSTAISELDNVVFEGRETEIKTIAYFYRDGIIDLKVVYL